MYYSKLFIPTLKQSPTDAEVVSHKLMVRAGMIRQMAAGIYSILPLGLRVLKKVEQIIREEMDGIGGQEVFMPQMCTTCWRRFGGNACHLRLRRTHAGVLLSL